MLIPKYVNDYYNLLASKFPQEFEKITQRYGTWLYGTSIIYQIHVDVKNGFIQRELTEGEIDILQIALFTSDSDKKYLVVNNLKSLK